MARDDDASRAAVRDPGTSGAELAVIASRHPELWTQVVAHVNASRTVLESLAALGDEPVRAAAKARLAALPPVVLTPPKLNLVPERTEAAPTGDDPGDDGAPAPKRRWRRTVVVVTALALVLGAGAAAYLLGPPAEHARSQTQPTREPVLLNPRLNLPTGPIDGEAPGDTPTIWSWSATVDLPVAALTRAQFKKLYTTTWPNAAQESAMRTTPIDPLAYANCPVAAMQFKSHLVDRAASIAHGAPSSPRLEMVLFDDAVNANPFPAELRLCLREAGAYYTDASVTSVYTGTYGDMTMYTLDGIVVAWPDGTMELLYFTVASNVVLLRRSTFPPGASAVGDANPQVLIGAFRQAVELAAAP